MASGRFTLSHEGRDHVVTVDDAGWKNVYSWRVDDVEVASKDTMDENVELKTGPDHKTYPDATLIVKGGWFSVHRATLVQEGDEVDLVPDPGTAAAKREARIREHPTRHTVIAAAAAIAKIVGPLLIGLVAFRFALPAIPWPTLNIDLPSINWPTINLPSIPWPSIELPSIPWPDWEVPSWLKWLLENGRYIIPVLIALAIARREVRRRSKQDERRSAAQPVSHSKPAPPTSSEDDKKPTA